MRFSSRVLLLSSLVFLGACSEGGKERILELFARNAPHLVGLPSTRAMIE